MSACGECGATSGHKPYCSQGGGPGRKNLPPPDPRKQHPVKRPDDGRKKRR